MRGIQQDLGIEGASSLSGDTLKKLIRDHIVKVLESRRQPGAGELLEELENALGWRVRQFLLEVVKELYTDNSVASYNRDYLKTGLCVDELQMALRGEAKSSQDFKSTIDDLFHKSRIYKTSAAFKEAVEFTAKFKDYAPFNNMLVRLQNPSCGFYATAKDWDKRFKRQIKEDARPMLILAPMHPVLLVYDLDATEGPPLPDHFERFAMAIQDSESSSFDMQKTLMNAERDHIQVQFKPLSKVLAGFATTSVRSADYKMRIVVDEDKDLPSRYAVLAHELAHIYLGHLGSDKDGWWPSRINLSHAAVEIEAEAVSYILALRSGLRTESASYVCSYLQDGGSIPESVSLELIAKTAGRIEEMGKRKLPPRKKDRMKEEVPNQEQLFL